jgi:hypothetical protein
MHVRARNIYKIRDIAHITGKLALANLAVLSVSTY